MRKKRVFVHGTPDSLQKFFSDAVSRDFDVVAVLNDEPEKISVTDDDAPVEVLMPQSLPNFALKLVDGIIFTDAATNQTVVKNFFGRGLEPRKIILWDAAQGWGTFTSPAADAAQLLTFCGLEFHIRTAHDENFFRDVYDCLQSRRRFKNLDPKSYRDLMAKDFFKRTGRPLDFEKPRTFTEKLQWLKLYDSTPIKSRLADKYLVRSWVADKIGGEYLIPLLGVWNDFDDIDFDELPDQFVLKCNHGSAMNVIVRDKNSFDIVCARERLNAWLAVNFAVLGLELHYTRIKPKIIAEKFMTDGAPDLTDYKFWCFDGKPALVQCETARSTDLRFDYFDMDFNHTDIERSDHRRSDCPEKIPRPKNFELMKRLAAALSEGFPFVRVDFYEIDGRVYFGEMTFTPGAGTFFFKSEGTDEYLGSLLMLPKPTTPPRLC